MVIFIFCTFQRADPSQVSGFNLNFCAGVHVGILLYSNFLLYLNPQSPPSTTTSFLKKFSWALNCIFNPRGIGTSWGIKRIPPFSHHNPSYIPSRMIFIITRSLTAISFLFLLRAFNYIDSYYWELVRDGEYAPERESILRRLHQVDMYELLNRLYLPLQFILPTYSRLSAYHCSLSVLAVLSGDEPSNWPPPFGSPADAYSLRRYWGHFWHQFYRVAFVVHADLFAHKLLRVKKRTALSRAIMTVVIFLMSGGMHGASTGLYGQNCEVWPVVYWYMSMGIGIILEDWAIWIWNFLIGERSQQMRIWYYVIGYMWVWAFYAWSLPKLIYPIIDCRCRNISLVE